MIDVLVTQHSKWTARRVRRGLFGQSLVDFTADPWIGIKGQEDCKTANIEMKKKSKQSRLEKEFSQADSQTSQATAFVESASVCDFRPSREEQPSGTVYFSSDASHFQDFSAFQKQSFQQSFQDPHFLHSFQDSPFRNEQYQYANVTYPQEQVFSKFSGDPDV